MRTVATIVASALATVCLLSFRERRPQAGARAPALAEPVDDATDSMLVATSAGPADVNAAQATSPIAH
jgi:hypothetical protein